MFFCVYQWIENNIFIIIEIMQERFFKYCFFVIEGCVKFGFGYFGSFYEVIYGCGFEVVLLKGLYDVIEGIMGFYFVGFFMVYKLMFFLQVKQVIIGWIIVLQ